MSSLKAIKPEDVKTGHARCLLYGKPGCGKTWFALSFPSPYFCDTESGANLAHYMSRLKASGGAYFGRQDGSTDFPTLLGQIQALATEKHAYRTLVIDSISKIYQLSIAAEQERLGEPKDIWGASKKPAIANMRRLVNRIARLDMNVVFVAHQVAEYGLVNGQRQETGSIPDIWDKLSYEIDLVMRIEHPSRLRRTATITKSRLLEFPECDQLILQDGEADLGYSAFSARYGQSHLEAPSTPIELITNAELAVIERLVGVLKLEENEIERVLTKAGVESYAELDSVHAKKFITWLGKKMEGSAHA